MTRGYVQLLLITLLLVAFSAPIYGQRSSACGSIEGAELVDSGGDYFGRVASPYSADSIYNKYGTYGSRYSGSSIWNPYGAGSRYRSDSPWNRYSQGLRMVRNGVTIGRLTINQYATNAVSPLIVAATCYGLTDLVDPNE